MKLYTILTPRGDAPDPSAFVALWESLYAVHHPSPETYFTLEWHAKAGEVTLRAAVPDGLFPIFERAWAAVHPAVEFVEASDPLADCVGEMAAARLTLWDHFMFPLAQEYRPAADPVTGLISALGGLGEQEQVCVQVTLQPVHLRHTSRLEHTWQAYQRSGARPSRTPEALCDWPTALELPIGMLYTVADWAYRYTQGRGQRASQVLPEVAGSVRRKIDGRYLLDATVRILAVAADAGSADTNLAAVVSAFAPLAHQNRWHTHREDATTLLPLMRARSRPFHKENFLGPAELAAMLHTPAPQTPLFKRLPSRRMPVPDGIQTYPTIEAAQAAGAIVIGVSRYRGTTRYIGFTNLRMLMQHLYCIGATGSGKTTMLQLIALQVAVQHGAGLTFFDVKGDAVKHLMTYLPEAARNRVIYIDLSQDLWFMPFNVLRFPGLDLLDLVTLIVNVFLAIFGEQSIQAHSQKMLRASLIAILEQDPDATLYEAYRMFTDAAYRQRIIAGMERQTEYPHDVLHFWRIYDDPKGMGEKRPDSAAIQNKLEYILQATKPKHMLTQPGLAFDWREAMDSSKIVLVNLDIGRNDPTIQKFFGTLFTRLILKAAFSRSDQPEADRVPHLFILDEFEQFTEQSGEFADLLALARAYGLGLCLTHQSVKQLDDRMLSLIADNTFTQISLMIGDGSSGRISKLFPGFQPDDLTSLLCGSATGFEGVARLRKLDPQPFTFNTLAVEDLFEPQGSVENLIQDQHQRLYRPRAAVQAELAARRGASAQIDTSGAVKRKKPPA
jgi:hypothetical protein